MATAIIASASSAPAQKPVTVFTVEQYKLVLETIAGRAQTLFQLLAHAEGGELDEASRIMIDAGMVIATNIGAMADTATGSGIMGNHEDWNFGLNFARLGKAVRS